MKAINIYKENMDILGWDSSTSGSTESYDEAVEIKNNGDQEATTLVKLQEVYQKLPNLVVKAYQKKYDSKFELNYRYIFRAALDYTYGKPYSLCIQRPAKKNMDLYNIKKCIKRMLEYSQDPNVLFTDLVVSKEYRQDPRYRGKMTYSSGDYPDEKQIDSVSKLCSG